jgi:hypothetical protein
VLEWYVPSGNWDVVTDLSRLAKRKALKHASPFVTPQFGHRPDVLAVVFIATHRWVFHLPDGSVGEAYARLPEAN